MAKDTKINVMTLPPSVRKDLEGLEGSIVEAENALETLASIGMDVSSIKAKLQWAKKVKKTLLSEFK